MHRLYFCMQHSLYLKIQLEDEHNFQDALAYVSSLPFDLALEYTNKYVAYIPSQAKPVPPPLDVHPPAHRYGKKLAEHLPDQTCRLLKLLCTQYTPTPLPSSPVEAVAAARAPSEGLGKAVSAAHMHFPLYQRLARSLPARFLSSLETFPPTINEPIHPVLPRLASPD